jgi:uncharacterized membrane protein HdeD (DUF308 family)
MKKTFYSLMFLTVVSLVVGMFRFHNFRDRLYLVAMLLGFLAIFSGIEYIANKLESK